ncbi:MAG: hypothetical protein HOP14_05890 [Acidobacteria bacterium]|nr:hypothetical protein [Acidobacteriota bacterium]
MSRKLRLPAVVVVLALGACSSSPTGPSLLREDPHGYFQELSARADRLYSYSLRDQLQLDQYVAAGVSRQMTYNPGGDSYPLKQDAAKLVLGEDQASVEIPQMVRLPIHASAGTALLTWDVWWGPEYMTDLGGIRNHKAFQVASPLASSERWLEIRARYTQAAGAGVNEVDARPYAPLGPNTTTGLEGRLEPMLAEFAVAAATWTRYWVLIEFEPLGWDRVSLWVADENRSQVQLLNRVEMRSAGGITRFWFEWNSSQRRTGGPLVSYVRNVVVLGNVQSPTALFRRPVGG